MMKKLTLIVLLTLSSITVFASPQTVILSVPTMSCSTCPFTVKLALKKVIGVDKADVSFNEKQAIVVFDDEITTIDALITATTNAGYPSTVIAQEY